MGMTRWAVALGADGIPGTLDALSGPPMRGFTITAPSALPSGCHNPSQKGGGSPGRKGALEGEDVMVSLITGVGGLGSYTPFVGMLK
jgi:hypothetical protein